MYVDKNLVLSNEQDIGAGAGSQLSDYSVDLGVARNIANGRPLYVVVVVDETFAGGTSLQIAVVTDSVETLNDTVTTHIETPAILQADLTEGRMPIVIPISNIGVNERYLGLYYTDSGTFSAGKVTAFIALDPFGSAY